MGTVWIALGLVLLAYLVVGLIVYLNGGTGGSTKTLSAIFPYPAATVYVPGYLGWFLYSFLMYLLLVLSAGKLIYLGVSGLWRRTGRLVVTAFVFIAALASLHTVPSPGNVAVTYHSFIERFDALQNFQNKQKQQAQAQQAPTDTSPDELKANAMNQLLVLNRVIQQEAVKADVRVSKKEITDTYKQYADRLQGEDNLKKQLKEFLGWSPQQFKNEIKTKLLQDKLNGKLSSDDKINKDRRKKAEDFLKQIKTDKKDFAEVAKSSDDPTAPNGGDQGVVKRGENDPEIEKVAFSMNNGDISDILKTQRGYVIIKVDEKQADSVHLHQILVRTKSLQEYIPEELKNAKVKLYVKDLVWDRTLNQVQSKNKRATPEPQPSGSAQPAPPPPTNVPAQGGVPAQPAAQ